LTPTDASWLAGIFEGEGCTNVYRHSHWGKNTRVYYDLLVVIGNTDQSMIARMCHVFPTKSVGRQVKSYKPHESPVWYYRLFGEKAEAFLLAIFPYMRTDKKRAQVAGALADWAIAK
jgi:hypothetical protein